MSDGVHRRDVVLVTGPARAGVTSLISRLRERMPLCHFVETGGEAVDGVVFVASAVAPLTESDCVLAEFAAARTGVVIGVVSKIDDHRGWRQVLDSNRDVLRGIPWVGAAAAPRLGEPRLDELVALLRRSLDDPAREQLNRLRECESRLEQAERRRREAVTRRAAHIDALRSGREDVVRARRVLGSGRAAVLRHRLQLARLELTYAARSRCASVRTELVDEVAVASRRDIAAVEARVRRRCEEAVADLGGDVAAHLDTAAAELGFAALPPPSAGRPLEPPGPALRSRRLETQLMAVLGAGFGIGVALVVARFLSGLSPGHMAAASAAGVGIGLAVTVWVVRVRGLLHDRAELQRWIGDVTAVARTAAEEYVATTVLAAESTWTSAAVEAARADSQSAARRIAGIDAELRRHAAEAAAESAVWERESAALRQRLDAARAALKPEVAPDFEVTDR